MELSEYINSEEYKKYSNNNDYLKCVIYYYLLFNEDFSNIGSLLDRLDSKNIISSFSSIVTNKLAINKETKKELVKRILDSVGNLKYEIKNTNNSSYFKDIIKIFRKYNIEINIKNKTINSNDINKVYKVRDILDSRITALANLCMKNNTMIYLESDYENIKISLYKFMKKKNFSDDDIVMVAYLLDAYKLYTYNEFIVSNNIKVDNEKIEEILKKYKNDIKLYLQDLLSDDKERKSECKIPKAVIKINDVKPLDDYLNIIYIQETIKGGQEEQINDLSKRKDYLSSQFSSLSSVRQK